MESYEGMEKREFLRVDYETSVAFDTCSEKEVLAAGDGVTKNISTSGLLFTANAALVIGAFIAVKLDMHTLTDVIEMDDSIVQVDDRLLAKVVRVEELLPGKEFDIGVCFIKSSENIDLDVDVDKIKEILVKK